MRGVCHVIVRHSLPLRSGGLRIDMFRGISSAAPTTEVPSTQLQAEILPCPAVQSSDLNYTKVRAVIV